MSLPEQYVDYTERKYGMDHDRYQWSDLYNRKPLSFSDNNLIALWVMPILQWFPLNTSAKPFRAPGGLTMPYPDLRHYTNRDYGNRVGIFRLLKLLKSFNVKGSVAINSEITERYPELVALLLEHDLEWIAHSKNMSTLHYTGMENEELIIQETLQQLRKVSGQAISGWLSPGRAQSINTMDILAKNHVLYNCDWANDDLPYEINVQSGKHYSLPLAFETDDRFVQLELFQTATEWKQQIIDRFDVLIREAEQYGGRILSLPLHAWVSGVPYRSTAVYEVLEYILNHKYVWCANGTEILECFRSYEEA